MSTITTLPLPVEVITMVLEEAWKATETSAERLTIYNAFAPASSDLLKALVRIAFRFVRMTLSQHDTGDFKLYSSLHVEAACLAADYDSPEASIRQLFHQTQFDLLINCRLARRKEQAVFSEIARLVKDCKTFTLAKWPGCPLGREECVRYTNLAPAVFQMLLPAFPSLTHVALEDSFDPALSSLAILLEEAPPPPPLRTVRALRVHAFQDHSRSDAYLPAAALRLLPALRALHIARPIPLKLLVGLAPPTLERLTLEAPLMEHIRGRAPFSTVVEYNIAAGLRRGLARRGAAGCGLRTIVVLTGSEEPYGWAPARAACEEYGVELVHEVVDRY